MNGATVTDKVRLYGLGLGYLSYVAVIVKFKLRLRLGTGGMFATASLRGGGLSVLDSLTGQQSVGEATTTAGRRGTTGRSCAGRETRLRCKRVVGVN